MEGILHPGGARTSGAPEAKYAMWTPPRVNGRSCAGMVLGDLASLPNTPRRAVAMVRRLSLPVRLGRPSRTAPDEPRAKRRMVIPVLRGSGRVASRAF